MSLEKESKPFREALAFEAARYAFGTLPIERMREAIDRLVNDGVYYETFYDVLYPDDAVTEVIGPAFERSLRSLGIPVPDYEDSVWIIIHEYLNRIANGEVDPYVGLSELMVEVYRHYDFYAKAEHYIGDSHRIDMLIGLYWGYDDLTDRPDEVSLNDKFGEEAVQALKKAIHAEAKKWVAECPVRK